MRNTKVWVSFAALALIAAALAWAHSTSAASKVRTDGVYYLCVYSNPGDPQNPVCTYVRFLADGSGLYVLSADKPEQVVLWLTEENRAGELGSYSVSDGALTFQMPLPNGMRTLQGELTSDGWMTGSVKYAFFAAPVVAEEPAPGTNRIPIVTATIKVSNRIELGPTGRQEGLTTTVSVNASDPDGDPLTFTWSAWNGSLSPEGNSVVWRRPVDYGRAREGLLVVEVSDDKGGKTTRAWMMH
jgi:hypothetical protein